MSTSLATPWLPSLSLLDHLFSVYVGPTHEAEMTLSAIRTICANALRAHRGQEREVVWCDGGVAWGLTEADGYSG